MKILIIDTHQLGYHTEVYFYAKHLAENNQVSYIGTSEERREFNPGKVKVFHLPYTASLLKKHYHFYKNVYREIKSGHYDIVLIYHVVFCSILRILFPNTNIAVHVYCTFVRPSAFKTHLFNSIIKFDLKFFKNVTFISDGLAAFLNFRRKYTVIPLGAELPETDHTVIFNDLSLLYVGTFFDRNIDITVRGLRLFLDRNNPSVKVKYTIIGEGPGQEIDKIKNEITRLDLSAYVEFKGEIWHPEVKKYFLENNIGVSFIPAKPVYDFQPPTKNLEYLIYGMPIIATATKYNKDFVRPEFGTLIPDTEEGFCFALEDILRRLNTFDSKTIQKFAKQYSFENIVKDILEPYLLDKAAKS